MKTLRYFLNYVSKNFKKMTINVTFYAMHSLVVNNL
ncbi:hypothetical protein OKW21_002939 [Catalinimonas alkaloidigena]|nr:hypothetical protein [Catalinimonas alkaloidigena]